MIKGIYSTTFAARIKDEEYKPDKILSKYVYVTSDAEEIWDLSGFNIEQVVGVVVDVPQDRNVPQRIAPRQIVGLIIPDGAASKFLEEYRDFAELFLNAEKSESYLAQRLKELGTRIGNLPISIYGTSGALYWPKKMSHEEIVEELRRKNEVQQV